MRVSFVTAVLTVALAGPAAATWPENPIPDPGFDAVALPSSAFDWSTRDAADSASSGSARREESSCGSGCTRFVPVPGACVPTAPGESHTFGARLLRPDDETPAANVYLQMRWRAGADCTESFLGAIVRTDPVTELGRWTYREATAEAPPGTVSVQLEYAIVGSDAPFPQFSYFDDVFFSTGAQLLANRTFETDASPWVLPSWSDVDVRDSPQSGSALDLGENCPSQCSRGVTQCVPATLSHVLIRSG